MYAFIDAHRGAYEVELIYAVLQITLPVSFRHRQCQADPTCRSVRAQRDEVLGAAIRRVHGHHHVVYCAWQVWHQLLRDGITAARCTVELLMQQGGLHGVVRGQRPITTRPDTATPCAEDRVHLAFQADRADHR